MTFERASKPVCKHWLCFSFNSTFPQLPQNHLVPLLGISPPPPFICENITEKLNYYNYYEKFNSGRLVQFMQNYLESQNLIKIHNKSFCKIHSKVG